MIVFEECSLSGTQWPVPPCAAFLGQVVGIGFAGRNITPRPPACPKEGTNMSHPLLIVLRNSLHSVAAVLGLALLLDPLSSLAATTPTYLVQPKVTGSFGIVSCGSYSIFSGSMPD